MIRIIVDRWFDSAYYEYRQSQDKRGKGDDKEEKTEGAEVTALLLCFWHQLGGDRLFTCGSTCSWFWLRRFHRALVT